MNITVTRDPRTREIQIRGPDGFVESLEDQIVAEGGLLGVQRVLNAAYDAGCIAGRESVPETERAT